MEIKKLLFSLVLCLGAGGIGYYFTKPSIGTWYDFLQKPVFTPPNWIFGPVWTVLYIMMGIALYCLWKKRNPQYKSKVAAYTWFYIQLILNIMWSGVFFGNCQHSCRKCHSEIPNVSASIIESFSGFSQT